mgnify:CR=1 FL=1
MGESSRVDGERSMSKPDWVSIKEYAAHYSLHPNTVAKWIEHGLLVAWKVRHTVRVKRQPPFDKRPPGPQPTS